MPGVADADHGGNGQRSDGHGVGHRRARQHAEHRRAEYRHLGGTACIAAGHGGGHIQEQLSQPDAGGQHAEQHKVEHVGGHHAHRHAVHALAGQVHVVDDLGPGVARMLEQAREVRAEHRVDHEDDGDDGQRPAHGAPRGLQQADQEDRPHEHVLRQRVAHAKRQVLEDVGDVQRRQGQRDGDDPVIQRNAAGRVPGGLGLALIVGLGKAEHQEDQAQHECQMHAAVRGFAQQAEPGRVVMKEGQRDEQARHDPGGCLVQRPEADFGVVLFRELLGFLVIYFHRRVLRVSQQAGPLMAALLKCGAPFRGKRRRRFGGGPATSAGRFPCRTSRRPDGTGCPRP
ncbi:hypothetical protein D3C86_1227240 [compost metagenome]